MRINEILSEGFPSKTPIILSTDPKYFGATVDQDYDPPGPVVDIPISKLVGFEPDNKMSQAKSQKNVKNIVSALKNGDQLPPILVRKYKGGYQIVDGHHRFHAYKLLGKDSIPAKIVPNKDISIKENITPR